MYDNIVKANLSRINIGIKIDGEIVPMIWFADDIVVIVKSDDDIQRGVYEMLRTSEIKINSAKTKILVCAGDSKIKTRRSRWNEISRELNHIWWNKQPRAKTTQIALTKTTFS